MTVQHQSIAAADLRTGDLMRVGSSTNYVLVADAELVGGRIAVTVYNGTEPNPDGPTLVLKPRETVSLSMRNQTP